MLKSEPRCGGSYPNPQCRDKKDEQLVRHAVNLEQKGVPTPNENKMSDGGRGRASLEVKL
jgi:hypothetical protein